MLLPVAQGIGRYELADARKVGCLPGRFVVQVDENNAVAERNYLGGMPHSEMIHSLSDPRPKVVGHGPRTDMPPRGCKRQLIRRVGNLLHRCTALDRGTRCRSPRPRRRGI